MGCGASKETAVSTSVPQLGGTEIPPESAGLATERHTSSGLATQVDGDAPMGVSLSGKENARNNPIMMMDPATMVANLNDVVHNANLPQGRGRFLSYASGASTPNTSAENLSWDGNSITPESIEENDSSVVDVSKRALRGNPKNLRKQGSGSAIGLDGIHQSEGAGLTSKVVHIEVPFGKPIEEVYDGVHNGPVLGSGVSGLVRLVTHKATGVEYAVKCLDLGLVGTKEGLAQLREEIFIMCQLDHPNIVRLEEVYESHSEIYLVQELCLGGELFDRLDEQPDYHYTEAECARLVKQMLSAVRYLHSKGIIHRDLKLENFLFSSKATDSELKMIDFGLSKHFHFGEVHHEAVGTPYTVAPEVIRGSYDERCDIWAIGVISFLLLSGDPPFGGCGGPEALLTVRANILACKYAFEPEDIWGLVSGKAKEFVKCLLVLDPKDRPTAREAQRHSWLREWASRASTKADSVLNPNVVKALVGFKEFSHMRKLLSEVLSFTLLPDQIKELRKEFEKIDTDGSGEISLGGLKQVLVTNAGAGSLGALKEEEVEDIFNAMRVNKAETRIHWHEFIAAGLSQCQVDDRNLRLAFDRLDSNHKGFVTLDDIMNLVGNDGVHSEEHLRIMWRESMRSVNCTTSHITYEHFLLLMKGQTKEPELPPPSPRRPALGPVPEIGTMSEDNSELLTPEEVKTQKSAPLQEQLVVGRTHFIELKTNDESSSLSSLPNMTSPSMYDTSFSTLEVGQDSPLLRGKEITVAAFTDASKMPDCGVAQSIQPRKRSKSVASETEATSFDSDDSKSTFARGDSRRALVLPERDSKLSEELSKNQSALVVNRQLYRAHRQMRLSVMEASRRFEEEQARRARDALMAQKAKEAGMLGLGQAGLVMRHGHKVQVTTENIRQYLEDYRAEQQQLVDKATRRGGRGRGNRKKTISDMSAMMNPSLGQDDLGNIAVKAARTPDVTKDLMNAPLPSLPFPELTVTAPARVQPPGKAGDGISRANTTYSGSPGDTRPNLDVVDRSPRKATVPGEFHQTKDPFSSDGMYGGSRIGMLDVNQIKTSG